MRATLTIDDDIAAGIEDRRRRDGLSMKQVVNLLLREGLRSSRQKPGAKPYRTKTHALGLRPGFDATRLNQLVDELEMDERLAREAYAIEYAGTLYSNDGDFARFDGLRWRNPLAA